MAPPVPPAPAASSALTLRMALRNARRSWRRSLLTAAAITIGTALLHVGMAWQNGVLDGALNQATRVAGHVRVVTTRYADREAVYPLAENLPRTDPLLAAINGLPGARAYARLALPATVSVGDTIGEEFTLVQGAANAYYTEVLQLDRYLYQGRMIAEGAAGDKEVVVGRTVAEDAGLKLGDEVVFLGQTQDGSLSPIKQTVVGISDFGSRQQNKMVYISLEKARYMADIPEGATEIVAFAEDRALAVPLADRIRALPAAQAAAQPGAPLAVQAWNQRKPWSDLVRFITPILTIMASVIVGLTGLVVLNTMLMSVLERTAEIGVLRALGMRRSQTLTLFVTEALGIALVGGTLGAILGTSGALYLQHYGVNIGQGVSKLPAAIPLTSTVYGLFEPINLVYGMILSLLMAVFGSLLPAWRASRIEPVEAMRQRR